MLRVFSPCSLFSETEAAYFTQACSFVDIQAYFSINRYRIRLFIFAVTCFQFFCYFSSENISYRGLEFSH